MPTPITELSLEFKSETQMAYLVSDGDNAVWIPKSQILEEEFKGNGIIDIVIPEWLAIEKRLV